MNKKLLSFYSCWRCLEFVVACWRVESPWTFCCFLYFVFAFFPFGCFQPSLFSFFFSDFVSFMSKRILTFRNHSTSLASSVTTTTSSDRMRRLIAKARRKQSIFKKRRLLFILKNEEREKMTMKHLLNNVISTSFNRCLNDFVKPSNCNEFVKDCCCSYCAAWSMRWQIVYND